MWSSESEEGITVKPAFWRSNSSCFPLCLYITVTGQNPRSCDIDYRLSLLPGNDIPATSTILVCLPRSNAHMRLIFEAIVACMPYLTPAIDSRNGQAIVFYF